MGIGRIEGIYGSYPVEPIKRVDLETVREQDEIAKQQANMVPSTAEQDTQTAYERRYEPVDLENISLNFNAGDTYDHIGSKSDLTLLDMEQVLSDMKKDSVLEQYRYFVGDEEAGKAFHDGLSGDGIVVMK